MELRMRKSIVATVITLAALLSVRAHAQDSWSTRSELGFVASRGNTSTETGNAKIQVIREVKRWKYTLETSGLYGKSQGTATAQHVDGRLQAEKSFGKDERWFWFGSSRYEDDRFSGFDYQSTVTTGLGRKFIDSETTKLTAQVGGGYRALRPELIVRDDTTGLIVARILGERDKDFVVNGSLTFSYAFNPQTRVLDQVARTEPRRQRSPQQRAPARPQAHGHAHHRQSRLSQIESALISAAPRNRSGWQLISVACPRDTRVPVITAARRARTLRMARSLGAISIRWTSYAMQ